MHIFPVIVTNARRLEFFQNLFDDLNDAIYHIEECSYNCVYPYIFVNNSEDVRDYIKTYIKTSYRKDTTIVLGAGSNIGIASGLQHCINQIKIDHPDAHGDSLFLKLDDDVKIYETPNFFERACFIHKMIPSAVFSPFPVGLINNLGGPHGYKHAVLKGKYKKDIITVRYVNHVGGMCRFSPFNIFEKFSYTKDLISGASGNEDGQFSEHCLRNGIPMVYTENGFVVEHYLSTLGQIAYDREYFNDRSFESSVNVEIINHES